MFLAACRSRAYWLRVATLALPGATALPPGIAHGAANVDGIVRLTTNYVHRGYSKSENNPSIQGNLDVQYASGFFFGGWISSVDFGAADVELNPYLGLPVDLSSDWQVGITLAGYLYDGKVLDRHANYGELTGYCAYRDLGSINASIAPDYLGTGHTVFNYSAALNFSLTETLEVSGSLGYQVSSSAIGYDIVHGNLGVSWFARPNLTVDLRYHEAHDTYEKSDHARDVYSFSEYDLDQPVTLSISLGF